MNYIVEHKNYYDTFNHKLAEKHTYTYITWEQDYQM